MTIGGKRGWMQPVDLLVSASGGPKGYEYVWENFQSAVITGQVVFKDGSVSDPFLIAYRAESLGGEQRRNQLILTDAPGVPATSATGKEVESFNVHFVFLLQITVARGFEVAFCPPFLWTVSMRLQPPAPLQSVVTPTSFGK